MTLPTWRGFSPGSGRANCFNSTVFAQHEKPLKRLDSFAIRTTGLKPG